MINDKHFGTDFKSYETSLCQRASISLVRGFTCSRGLFSFSTHDAGISYILKSSKI